MLISISEQDPRPIYTQIAAEIKRQIHEGALKPGDELPSVRELADNLGINLHTVHHAYRILREQGIVFIRLGQRAKVAPLPSRPSWAQVQETLMPKLDELVVEAFHMGLSAEEVQAILDGLIKRHGDRRQ